MAKTEHYYTQFEHNTFYHIYNRSVDKKPMFKNDGNFAFFLKKYDLYLTPIVNTYAYCLLGNHFHLLVKIKDIATVDIDKYDQIPEIHGKSTHDVVSHQFRKFFQSYAQAFNKQQSRIGTLFQTPFKRAIIDSESYFTNLIYYIHANPQIHGLVGDFKEWNWSSYHRILMDNPTKLMKKDVINWFGGKDNYLKFHQNKFDFGNNDKIILEDE